MRLAPSCGVLLCALMVNAACADADAPQRDEPAPQDVAASPPDSAAPLRTDTAAYVLTRDSLGWGAEIGVHLHNTTADTMYAVNCNGATTIAVERQDSGGWRPFWEPVINGCLSPAIILPPGVTINTAVSLWGAPPGGNVGPEFADTMFSGVYRLVWRNLVLHYDPQTPGFGDSVPTMQRVSNEFTLRTR